MMAMKVETTQALRCHIKRLHSLVQDLGRKVWISIRGSAKYAIHIPSAVYQVFIYLIRIALIHRPGFLFLQGMAALAP